MAIITAEALNGVHNQADAGTALQKALMNIQRGEARFAEDATAAIEKHCPALARAIRHAVEDWNHSRENLLLAAQPAVMS
jgi:hypothetical protein